MSFLDFSRAVAKKYARFGTEAMHGELGAAVDTLGYSARNNGHSAFPALTKVLTKAESASMRAEAEAAAFYEKSVYNIENLGPAPRPNSEIGVRIDGKLGKSLRHLGNRVEGGYGNEAALAEVRSAFASRAEELFSSGSTRPRDPRGLSNSREITGGYEGPHDMYNPNKWLKPPSQKNVPNGEHATTTRPIVSGPPPIIRRTPTNTQTTNQANQLRIVPAATVEATNSTSQVAVAAAQTPGASGATTEEISGFWNSFGKANESFSAKGFGSIGSSSFVGAVTGGLVGGVANLTNAAGSDSVSGSGFFKGAVKGAMVGAGIGAIHRGIGSTSMIKEVNSEYKGLGGFTKSLAEMAPGLTGKSGKVTAGALTMGVAAFTNADIHPSTRPINRMNY